MTDKNVMLIPPENLPDRVANLEARVKILETAFQFFVFGAGQEGYDPSEMTELV